MFDIRKVKRTDLLGNAKNIIATFFEEPKRNPKDPWVDQTPIDESEPADSWQDYGFISRLPAGAEALVYRFGQSLYTIASRALAAATVFGKMKEGDVAIYSIGGNVIRVNADGSVTILAPDGKNNMVFSMSPKRHAITLMTAGGRGIIISDDDGITIHGGDKEVTTYSQKAIQNIAPEMNDMVGTHSLHVGAKRPLNAATVAAGGAPNVNI
jgi:hypothetical protein